MWWDNGKRMMFTRHLHLPQLYIQAIPYKNKTDHKMLLTLYTLKSVCIFSIPLSIHFLMCWQGEFELEHERSVGRIKGSNVISEPCFTAMTGDCTLVLTLSWLVWIVTVSSMPVWLYFSSSFLFCSVLLFILYNYTTQVFAVFAWFLLPYISSSLLTLALSPDNERRLFKCCN